MFQSSFMTYITETIQSGNAVKRATMKPATNTREQMSTATAIQYFSLTDGCMLQQSWSRLAKAELPRVIPKING